jgi:small conductance mechanosensitive channel
MENDTLVEQVTESIQDTTAVNSMVDGVKKLASTPVSDWLPDLAKTYLVPLGLKILAAVVVLILGRWIIKLIQKWMSNGLMSRHGDATLHSFLSHLVSVLLYFLLIIAIIGILGINTSSLVALLASAGLAVGMSLGGTLQNFAGGVLIIMFRPFKVGDFIAAQGMEGVVSEIQIFNTHLLTTDNKEVILPNGALATGVMTNFSKQGTRRVDWVFSIAYGDDYDKAKAVLRRLLDENQSILKSPEPFIELGKLNSSSVDITVRAWVNSPDYWPVFFSMNEKVYKTFAQEGLNIPFPQMDVHVKSRS